MKVDVTVGEGRYRVMWPEGDHLHALRDGKQWRELGGDDLVLALAIELQEARDRLAALEKYGSQETVIILSAYGEALYLGDELLQHHYGSGLTVHGAMKALGYKVERIEVHWEDLGGGDIPASLTELKIRLVEAERRKRRERIEGLRAELAELEREDRESA